MDFQSVFIAGFAAAVVWMIAGSVLYMNPMIDKLYKKNRNARGMKKPSKDFMKIMFVNMLIQSVFAAVAYTLMAPILVGSILTKAIMFGLILVMVRNIPKALDTEVMTSYPSELTKVELVNGSISAVIIGLVFAYML